jgi:hypothetical protein
LFVELSNRMTKRPPKSSKSVAVLPTDYAPLLAEIKARIRTAQIKAALAANAELVLLYWQMGQRIAEMQAKEGWGAGVIPRLAADLHAEFPEMRGFSERNIGYMIRFAREYGEPPILQPAAAKLGAPAIVPTASAQLAGSEFVPQPAALLPWNFKAVGLFESVRSIIHKALMDKYFLFKLKPST